MEKREAGGVYGTVIRRVQQNDPFFPDWVYWNACYAFSLMAIPEEYFKIAIPRADKLDLIEELRDKDIVRDDCYVNDTDHLLFEVAKYFYDRTQNDLVFFKIFGENHFHNEKKSWGVFEGNYTVLHIVTSAGNHHFRFGDEEAWLLWDPWYPRRNARYEVSARYFQVIRSSHG
jgi:hypothetical protein